MIIFLLIITQFMFRWQDVNRVKAAKSAESLRKLKSKTSKFSLLEDVKYEKPVAKQAFWVKHWKGTSENERKMSYISGAINYV